MGVIRGCKMQAFRKRSPAKLRRTPRKWKNAVNCRDYEVYAKRERRGRGAGPSTNEKRRPFNRNVKAVERGTFWKLIKSLAAVTFNSLSFPFVLNNESWRIHHVNPCNCCPQLAAASQVLIHGLLVDAPNCERKKLGAFHPRHPSGGIKKVKTKDKKAKRKKYEQTIV